MIDDNTKDPTTEKPEKAKKKRSSAGQVVPRSEKKPCLKWLIRVFICKDASGKRHWFNETFNGTKTQANERLRDLLTKVKTGEPLKADNSQFNTFIDEWERSHPDLKDSSVEHYKQMMRLYVRPKLGGLMLARIGADNIQTLYADLRAEGISGSTITLVHTLLRSIFRMAVLRKRIRENPMEGVKSPRGKKLTQEQRRRRESRVMTPKQAQEFLSAAERTHFAALFTLAFHTGFRPGELLAVTWDDLNTETRTIKVWRNIKWPRKSERQDKPPYWYLDDPKTDASVRILRLDGGLVELLSAHRKRQLEDRMKAGKAWRDHGFIFCNEIGEPYSQNLLLHYFKKILRDAGLPETFTTYSARYSSATWMIDQGISAKTAAGRLGHGDVATTLRYYVHSTEGMDEQAVAKLAQLIEGKK